MSWAEAKKINSDLNTPLNDGGVKIVKSKQLVYAPSIQKSTLVDAVVSVGVNKGYSFANIDGYVRTPSGFDIKKVIECTNEAAGCIIISPVDKSKCLIISTEKTYYDNRDYDAGMIQRNTKTTLHTDNGLNAFFNVSAPEETLMCLEFY